MSELRDAVFEALDNAVANGYDQRFMETEALANDLLDCDADIFDMVDGAVITRRGLVDAVTAWKAARIVTRDPP